MTQPPSLEQEGRLEDLLARYLDGVLLPNEEAELAALLVDRPQALDEAVRLVRLHEDLREVLAPEAAPERLAAAVVARLRASNQSRRFASSLVRKLRQESSPGGVPGERRRASLSGWLAAAAVLLLGLGTFAVLRGLGQEPPWKAELLALQGAVEVSRNGVSQGASAGMPLLSGDGIMTGKGAHATLKYAGEATSLEMAEHSRVSLSEEGGAKRLALVHGTLMATVAPQPPGRPMVVTTPHARAEVVGTRFTLQASEGQTRLEVQQGQVRLEKADGAVAVVQSGSYAVAATSADLAAHPLAPALQSELSAPPSAIPITVRFDFEDGLASREWTGKIEAGPARPGSRYCIKGQYVPENRLHRVMLVDGKKGLFTYRPGAVLSFDYWIDDKVIAIDLSVWDRTKQASIANVPNFSPVKNQWGRTAVRLADLGAAKSGRLRDGDLVTEIVIQTNQPGGILYVDNVEVSVPDPERESF